MEPLEAEYLTLASNLRDIPDDLSPSEVRIMERRRDYLEIVLNERWGELDELHGAVKEAQDRVEELR